MNPASQDRTCNCSGCGHHPEHPCSQATTTSDNPREAGPDLCNDCKCALFWSSADASTIAAVTGDITSKENRDDIACSKQFLKSVHNGRSGCAVDVGAGNGRVSAGILRGFAQLHMVEPSTPLLAQALLTLPSAIGHAVPAQKFVFPADVDLVWMNWVMTYLSDDDCVHLLVNARLSLSPGGVVCVKDNVGKAGFCSDSEDGARTRTRQDYLELFALAGLCPSSTMPQKPWPKQHTQLLMFALKPGNPGPRKKTLEEMMPPSDYGTSDESGDE